MSGTELPAIPAPPPPPILGRESLCPACRYDLSATPDGVCPECGTPITHQHLRLIAIPDLADFKPDCPDCKYDLSASPDGRCPECGLRFTHDGLKSRWVARKQARRDQGRHLGLGILFSAAFIISGVVMMSSLVGFALVLAFWTCVAAAWCWWKRELMLARPQYFLAFILPLVLMMPAVAATPFGLLACAVLGAMCCVAGWLALRGAPLLSATLLLTCVVGPLLLFSGFIFVESASDQLAGRYWSSFNQPTPHGWEALPSSMSQRVAYGMAGVAISIALVVAFYARRAWVRLKARAESRGTTPPAST